MKVSVFVCMLAFTGMLPAVRAEGPLPDTAAVQFRQLYAQAMVYDKLSLYAPCIESLTQAIELATRCGLEEERISAAISLGEVLRKTGEYDKGLQLLTHLEGTTRFPQLHVRKLGRIAAICHEWDPPGMHTADTVRHYLDSALTLATMLDLTEEKAGLYNELGYLLYAGNREEGLAYLRRSAALYQALGDTHNYAGAMTNVLRCHMLYHDAAAAKAVIDELVPLIEGRQWYTAEIELYPLVATYYEVFLHDPATAARWTSRVDKSMIRNLEAVHSAQMNMLRTLYATRELRTRMTEIETAANQRQLALDRQTRRTRELVIYLSLMALLAAGVVALLLRERRLRQRLAGVNAALQVSNEKYQLLMVESNHRIKNNLQMVISMLEYYRQQPGYDNKDMVQSMWGKIQTISMLHKHLSAGAYHAPVGLDVYFDSIIRMYAAITPAVPPVERRVLPLHLHSERIIYFGLILNEMLANTIAHGAAESRGISVSVQAAETGYRFDYRDGSHHAGTAEKGTGSLLIRQLIERIGGTDSRFDAATGHYQFTFYG